MTAEAVCPSAESPATTLDRRLLIAVFAVSNTVAYVVLIQILPVIIDNMADDLGVSRTAVAGASTISTLMGALAAFPIGRLMDRHGGRMMMTAGSLIGVGAAVMWSQATSLAVLYAAFVFVGLAIAMSTYEAAFAVIVVATDAPHRDRTILAVTMIAGLSTYLVYPALGWMNAEWGWRTTLLVLSALLLVTAVPGHLMVIPSRERHRSRVQRRTGVPVGAAFRQRRFWLLLIAFVGQAGSVAAFLLLVISYLLSVGHSMWIATSIPVSIGAMQILSRLALVTVLRGAALTPVACGAFAIQGLGLMLLPLAGLSVPVTLLCVSAVGIGQGVGVIARPSIIADNFGVAHFASVLAAITVPMALARAASPLMGAWLGDWRFLVICGASALVASAALLPLLRGGRVSADSP
ncbi:MFS transporter [Gordonia polyisoprenivorans]|uniref:MFS transporter n=1 Tax=Gordonia polyisoprenivorans TaxID=84595 RepID=UPI000B99F1B3|nr:MFS transporter [Gordonia polyisoprenivorans]OZC33135.1 MFS transporter [Gordonia polyisoprenivorans]